MNKTFLSRRNWIPITVLFVFFLVFLYLFWNTPLGHDEWKWADPEMIELLKTGFRGYNGRYLGNLFILLVTRSTVVRLLLLSGCSVWLLALMARMAGPIKENTLYILVAFCLLFAMPSTLYRQSFGWVAAFTNFVPPVILFFQWTIWFFDEKDKPTIPVILLTCSLQLFSEHNTILFWLTCISLFILQMVRKKTVDSFMVSSSVGATIGFLLMFSNSSYRKAVNDDSGYKQIGQNLDSLYDKINQLFLTNCFKNNSILLCIIGVLLIALIASSNKKSLRMKVATVTLGFSMAYCLWMNRNPGWHLTYHEKTDVLLEGLVMAIYVISVAILLCDTLSGNQRKKALLLWLSSFLILVPLIVADPIGARCFFATYVFECVIALLLLNELAEKRGLSTSFLSLVACGMALTLCITYCSIFTFVGQSLREREQYIAKAVQLEEKEIVLHRLPYREYMMFTEPPDDHWEVYFRHYYNIDQDVKLVIQD